MKFFVPGTHPSLTLAELGAVLGPTLDYSHCSDELFLIETDRGSEELQSRLGGVVKIGKIVGELPRYNVMNAVEMISGLAHKASESTEGKIVYGLSVYQLGDKNISAQIKRDRQKIGLELKKRLKETGRSVRYVDSKEPELSAVIVTENGLLESAGEYVLIAATDRVYIGKTEAVQDYKEWSRRDYGRPASDPMSGMLPPKLARMMVNLATGGDKQQATSDKILMDPFCGSGTVLMEASLVGFNRLIGNDLETKAVEDTKTNMEWMNTEAEVMKGDASDIDKRVTGPIDAIVTEPYLGPPRIKKPSINEVGLLLGKLVPLYTRAFTAAFKLLPIGGRCIIAFPVFEAVDQRMFVPIKEILKQIGYTTIHPLPESAPIVFKERTPNGGLLYRRPDQFVAREILILQK